MKTLLIAILLISQQTFAAGGIDCKSIDGTLEISSIEAREEGDNVVTMDVNASFLKKSMISFSKLKNSNEVNVSRTKDIVYMANKKNTPSLTLVLNTGKRQGLSISTAYLKNNADIYVKQVICNSDN